MSNSFSNGNGFHSSSNSNGRPSASRSGYVKATRPIPPKPTFIDPDEVCSPNPDSWKPTEKTYEKFVGRDFALCSTNITVLLRANGAMSPKELKECLLHSTDTIERALVVKVEARKVYPADADGRYKLI
jgi:hypothetical protein